LIEKKTGKQTNSKEQANKQLKDAKKLKTDRTLTKSNYFTEE